MKLHYLVFLFTINSVSYPLKDYTHIVKNYTNSRIYRACRIYKAYWNFFDQKNCYYNSEYFQNVTGILDNRRIQYEKYTVVTEDGYILSLFRVGMGNKKGIVVFLHPLSADNVVWLIGRNESYVSTFLDAGYEVWLPNWRGLRFSRGHIRKLSSLEYWNFSFHEIGLYDYSAIFKFVHSKTQRKIIAISHSMGSTALLIYASLKAEESKKFVKIFIPMGSPAYMTHILPIARLLSYGVPNILQAWQRYSKVGALFESHRSFQDFIKKVLLYWIAPIIVPLVPIVATGEPEMANPEYIPMTFSISFQPICIKILYHYAQLMHNRNKFSMYDYGEKSNLKRYNSKEPPEYPLENISVPVYVVYGTTDELGDIKDTEHLLERLPESVKKYGTPKLESYSHVDFFWAKDVKEKILQKLVKLLDKI